MENDLVRIESNFYLEENSKQKVCIKYESPLP